MLLNESFIQILWVNKEKQVENTIEYTEYEHSNGLIKSSCNYYHLYNF